jgi:hypothetical protein
VVLALCGLVTFFVVVMAFGVLAAILLLLAMLAGKLACFILLALLYIALIILIYAFMMGVNHAMWHAVADGAVSGAPLPDTGN